MTFYVETPSVTASLERATQLGGKVVLARTGKGPGKTLRDMLTRYGPEAVKLLDG